MRTLLVENDPKITRDIEGMLKSQGFSVYHTDKGEEGFDLAKLYDYSIILLATKLPDMTGLEVLKLLRTAKIKTPVMLLGHPDFIWDEIQGLNAGADDYLSVPIRPERLIARINAIVRRSNGHTESVIRTGNLCVNLTKRTVDVSGNPVRLTRREYQMLELLSLRKGTTLSKEMFLNHLYGGADEPKDSILGRFIMTLRRKLSTANGGEHYITNVWGEGWVLRDPE